MHTRDEMRTLSQIVGDTYGRPVRVGESLPLNIVSGERRACGARKFGKSHRGMSILDGKRT